MREVIDNTIGTCQLMGNIFEDSRKEKEDEILKTYKRDGNKKKPEDKILNNITSKLRVTSIKGN